MGLTGLFMLLFVIAHVAGNTTIFFGADGINAYAEHLRVFPPALWAFRAAMAAILALHLWFGFTLTMENSAARPVAYAQKTNLKTGISARTMIYSGLVLLAFILYHLAHFTLHWTNPEISAGVAGNVDTLGRPDVFKMVVLSFNQLYISVAYLVALVFLLLHLSHGTASWLQSLGLTTERLLPKFGLVGKVVAFVLALGFAAVPVVILMGIINI